MAKILHLGNIANNAYNNAKYLNKSGSIQHHVLNFDNTHIMACPEWEEIDTFEPVDEFNPDWSQFNFNPPDWYQYTCLLYTSPSPRDKRQSRMPSSA